MAAGLIDADLGKGVVKKRVASPGRGKSGGVRTLVATNRGSRWFFVFGFEKNVRANIDVAELAAVQEITGDLLKLTGAELDRAVTEEALQEICHDHEDHSQEPHSRSRA